MAKRKKKSNSRKVYRGILILGIIILLGVMVVVIAGTFKQENDNVEKESQPGGSAIETETEIAGLSMPYALDSGLVIDTYFQYTGINPDCQEEEGVDVASIQVINQTGKYIKEALIEMTLDHSQTVSFIIKDLPQDAQLYAFDVNNTSCSGTAVATAFTEKVDFSDERALKEDLFAITYDAMSAEISNISEQTTKASKLIYHDQMEGILFGGISYQQEIDALNSGESIVIETPECYIGGPIMVGTTD